MCTACSTRLVFYADEAKYELWEVKFIGHTRLKKLHGTLAPKEGEQNLPDVEMNTEAFAELVQCLDDRTYL